jgi:hypothetical protein
MASYPTTVRGVVNGQAVEASITNQSAQDLAERTDWLKEQLAAVSAGSQIVIRSQTVTSGLAVGTPVYLDVATSTFKAAVGDVDTSTYKTAAPQAMWQGVISAISGATGDVLMAGTMTQSTVAWAALFDAGVFVAGPVYLSEDTAGKLSPTPGDLGIYVGHLSASGTLLVRGAGNNPYLSHVHLQRTLLGKPAGTVVDPAPGGTHTVNTPNAGQQGWLPANNTYFTGYVVGVQIPTGAKFGYNIQHASEAALREIFPLVPTDNAQFSQTGLVLYSSTVVVNQYGIWWMDDTYSNAPWPVDYAATTTADDIVLWTSRLMAQQDIVAAVSAAIAEDVNATVSTYAASRIVAGDGTAVTGSNSDVNGAYGIVTVTNSGVTALKSGIGATVFSPTAGLAATDAAPATGDVRVASRAPRPVRFGFVSPSAGAFLGKWYYDASSDIYAPTDTPSKETMYAVIDPIASMTVPEVSTNLEIVMRYRVNASAGSETTRSQLIQFYVYNDGQNGIGQVATINKTISISWGVPNRWQRTTITLLGGSEFVAANRPIIKMLIAPSFVVGGESYTNDYFPLIINSITYDLVPTAFNA